MAVEKTLKRFGGKTMQFASGDIFGNSFFGPNAGQLNIGTTDTSGITFTVNDVARWVIDGETGFLRRGSGFPYFGLQLYGTGAGSIIAFGDTFNSTTPYVFVGEYNGTDTDQLVVYGQKGAGVWAGAYASTTPQLWITQQGRIGFNHSSLTPTAKAHFAGSSSGSNNAAIKIDSGTLATAADGQIEYDGTNYYACVSTTRYQIVRCLTGSAVLNFASTNSQLSRDLTLTVTGATDGDCVAIGVPNASAVANSCYTGWVSAANTGTIRLNNYSAGAVDPASGTFKFMAFKNI